MSQLETNTTGLQALLDMVNALPDAGSGGEGGGTSFTMPDGYALVSGTYTPTTEGTNVLHNIQVAKSIKSTTANNYPIQLFAIFRKDGFAASGGTAERYIVSYIGVRGCGAVTYRNMKASGVTYAGGSETSTTYNYGLGGINSTGRTNCFFRYIDNNGNVVFSSYGIVTLEANKEYIWIAVIDTNVYEI